MCVFVCIILSPLPRGYPEGLCPVDHSRWKWSTRNGKYAKSIPSPLFLGFSTVVCIRAESGVHAEFFFFTYWHAQSPWLTKLQANEHMASWDSDLFFQPWRLAKKSGLFVGHCLGAGKQIGGSCAKWIFLRCRPCQDSGRSSCLVILAYLLWAPRLPL
jgi:hypothetical protein